MDMTYTPAMLARLAYSHAAYELSERLVSEAGTYGDEYGRGAFLTEEAGTIVSEARRSWRRRSSPTGFAARRGSRSRRLWMCPLMRRRSGSAQPSGGSARRCCSRTAYAENGGLGYTVAPYAVEEPDRVRRQLDAWVVEHRRSSGPDRDEPAAGHTRPG